MPASFVQVATRAALTSTSRLALLCALMIGWAGRAAAQTPPAESKRGSDAFEIPTSGVVCPGQDRRVEFTDAKGKQQVGILLVEVGDRRIAIVPTGRLISLPKAKAQFTDAPFRSATKDEIAADIRESGFQQFKTRSTARYVYVYNTSEAFQKGASRILETMYPAILAYFKRIKIPVHDPLTPLPVLMFRTEEQYRHFEDAPPGAAAYYSMISNHIVMYEQSKLVEVAPELAMKQSIGVIAHEGIHQILHNIGVQQRLSRWPLWTTEGLAEYFAPTSVDNRLRWKGVGQPHDLRMHELDNLLKQVEAEPGELVAATASAPRLTSTGYAMAWSLVHYLATKQRDKFHAYLRECSKINPLEPRDSAEAVKLQKQLFGEYFGSDYAALEKNLIKHVQALPYVDPVANQTHYVVMLKIPGKRTVGVTSSPAAVLKWQEDALTNLSAAVKEQAAFEILPFANKDSADQYAKQWLSSR